MPARTIIDKIELRAAEHRDSGRLSPGHLAEALFVENRQSPTAIGPIFNASRLTTRGANYLRSGRALKARDIYQLSSRFLPARGNRIKKLDARPRKPREIKNRRWILERGGGALARSIALVSASVIL